MYFKKSSIKEFSNKNIEIACRINSMQSDLWKEDLNMVLNCPILETVVIPKVETSRDIGEICHMIDKISPNRAPIRLIACIETAKALMNLKDICKSDKRLSALVVTRNLS